VQVWHLIAAGILHNVPLIVAQEGLLRELMSSIGRLGQPTAISEVVTSVVAPVVATSIVGPASVIVLEYLPTACTYPKNGSKAALKCAAAEASKS
jgi:hypothetical protein